MLGPWFSKPPASDLGVAESSLETFRRAPEKLGRPFVRGAPADAAGASQQ
jgi:hypothetical protein